MFINLTPHDVTIFVGWNEERVFPASGYVARCSHTTETIDVVEGIPVNRTTFGDVTGLPDPVEGVNYIVSNLVAQSVKGRTDVFFPCGAVRNEKGVIVGCKALSRY